MSFNDKPSLDELAHFGVKGMRWGHRNAQQTSGGGGGGGGHAAPAPKSNRQMNKEFRKEQNKKRDADIDAARERYNTQSRDRYLKAKAQYKADKKTIGSAAARSKFNEAKNKNLEDYEIASQAKSGKETAVAVLSVVGVVAVTSLLRAAAASR